MYWKLGDYENAILDFCEAIQIIPNDYQLRGSLALALHSVGRNDESISEYNSARFSFSKKLNFFNVYRLYNWSLRLQNC